MFLEKFPYPTDLGMKDNNFNDDNNMQIASISSHFKTLLSSQNKPKNEKINNRSHNNPNVKTILSKNFKKKKKENNEERGGIEIEIEFQIYFTILISFSFWCSIGIGVYYFFPILKEFFYEKKEEILCDILLEKNDVKTITTWEAVYVITFHI